MIDREAIQEEVRERLTRRVRDLELDRADLLAALKRVEAHWRGRDAGAAWYQDVVNTIKKSDGRA